MDIKREPDIHATDLLFYRLCEQNFGINRGVYNTIDALFYEKGMKEILSRRKMILSFLEFASGSGASAQSRPYRLKFGRGGLATKVDVFYSSRGVE